MEGMDSMNRWELTEAVRQEYQPVVQKWLDKITSFSNEELENLENEAFTLELSDTKLRPYTLMLLMKEFGFEKISTDDNGWELDFWIRMKHETLNLPFSNEICIHGCGMTFELNISPSECM